jgi:hypothetical protein
MVHIMIHQRTGTLSNMVCLVGGGQIQNQDSKAQKLCMAFNDKRMVDQLIPSTQCFVEHPSYILEGLILQGRIDSLPSPPKPHANRNSQASTWLINQEHPIHHLHADGKVA